ncbi:MAG: uncharacterized protein QOD06_2712 [Candidatus Binatota bacterium]|jgi:DNA-directed RNA polymerase subunit RPC12/RpoP|nr:uncharacterized protein [Candidatus Binatota bacterium]
MPNDEKDRFGEKLREKERAEEDRFFAQRDRDLLEKLRRSSSEQEESTIQELARSRCPRCGTRLVAKQVDGVEIDECPSCSGVWLDKGELEALSRRDSKTWLARVLGVAD